MIARPTALWLASGRPPFQIRSNIFSYVWKLSFKLPETERDENIKTQETINYMPLYFIRETTIEDVEARICPNILF